MVSRWLGRPPQISHLLFADDNLLFTRANSNEAEIILSILSTYQRASRQMVNMEKSECSFSQNLLAKDKNLICNRMALKTKQTQGRYLGMLVPFGRSKKAIFSFVVDRIYKKLKGWKEKFPSRADKETLVKAMAQAIPNYIISCYKIPNLCFKEIGAMISRFWWGTCEGKRNIHWLSWQKLAKNKKQGGLGFIEFTEFNTDLLSKHF